MINSILIFYEILKFLCMEHIHSTHNSIDEISLAFI